MHSFPSRSRARRGALFLRIVTPTVERTISCAPRKRELWWGVSPRKNANACVPNEPRRQRGEKGGLLMHLAKGSERRRHARRVGPIRNRRWHGLRCHLASRRIYASPLRQCSEAKACQQPVRGSAARAHTGARQKIAPDFRLPPLPYLRRLEEKPHTRFDLLST